VSYSIWDVFWVKLFPDLYPRNILLCVRLMTWLIIAFLAVLLSVFTYLLHRFVQEFRLGLLTVEPENPESP